MAEEFIDNSFPPADISSESYRDRETVRVILVGSQQGIETMIRRLYLARFAEIYEWSRLQPEAHSGKLMSVTTKSLWLS